MFEGKSLKRLKSIALVVRYFNDSRCSGIRPIFSFRIMRMNSYILFLNTLYVLNIEYVSVYTGIFELKNSSRNLIQYNQTQSSHCLLIEKYKDENFASKT